MLLQRPQIVSSLTQKIIFLSYLPIFLLIQLSLPGLGLGLPQCRLVPVGRARALPYTLFTFSCRLLCLDLFTLHRQMAAMSPPEVTWVFGCQLSGTPVCVLDPNRSLQVSSGHGKASKDFFAIFPDSRFSKYSVDRV